MDALDTLLDVAGGDGALLVGLLALVGAALILVLLVGVLRGRKDVRRRAAAEDPGGVTTRSLGGGRAEAQQSLERLMNYVGTAFGGSEKESRVLRRQLIQAGFFDAKAVSVYFAARLALALGVAVSSLLILPMLFDQMTTSAVWLWSGVMGVAGYLSPSFYVKRRIKRRTTHHRQGFPDFMDLMVVCSEAGLSMEASIDRIARELVEGYPSLAENLYMASLEMRAGKPFPEALERMGERLNIQEAGMLATLLQQSAELGTSLAQSLRVYSDEMRNKRMSRAEEKAYALPAKLVVPLTIFVFPVLIVTLLLPVVIRVMGSIGGG
ncbi:MAG: type II secretion system F family protein [Pseudomonadota bacterium]|nr:type II secretion system F family protein [Pseudomonadota bacterium]